MRKKFIIFDIDGTLLTTEMTFLKSTKQALVSLKEKGHDIGIATGRDYASAKSIVDELEIDTYVLCNGSGIGVAMGNAETAVKEKADLITDSCNEHGIYNALKRISLI